MVIILLYSELLYSLSYFAKYLPFALTSFPTVLLVDSICIWNLCFELKTGAHGVSVSMLTGSK